MGALVHWPVKVFILIGCLFWGWNKYLTNVTAAHGSWHFLAPHSFVYFRQPPKERHANEQVYRASWRAPEPSRPRVSQSKHISEYQVECNFGW
jgi:hypothetical protein